MTTGEATRAGTDLWVFGYGSLMWEPGFVHEESASALLRGYHRDFCIRSIMYRGTLERPGLVLGLAPGGACRGVAFRVAAPRVEETLAYLHEREMVHYVYHPRMVRLQLDGRRIEAHTYVADTNDRSFCGRLSVDEAADVIARSAGIRGPNREYLENTIAHLDAIGVHDARLHDILDTVRRGG
ncbi:MAG: gamma-glutamylcyclotransferase [Rhodospirillaceae bacterium]|jgi:glutathione-specific gamma-glutamylcyclotransferase|nr:gamma-glutamylcyclotransferase [Rhodospirillaceae bacterium]MBT6118382.1 gamma-glutamylcyclotransferase [Rhodospirillaceae bacterium]